MVEAFCPSFLREACVVPPLLLMAVLHIVRVLGIITKPTSLAASDSMEISADRSMVSRHAPTSDCCRKLLSLDR